MMDLRDYPCKDERSIIIMKKRIISILLCLSVLFTLLGCEASPEKSLWSDNDKVIKPSKEFIVECLQSVDEISEIEVEEITSEETDDTDGTNESTGETEEDDAPGYYVAVYFSVEFVNQDEITGSTLAEKGYLAGGCIEAFETVEEAEVRASAVDEGDLFDTNYQIAVGSMVLRISPKIEKAQQIALAAKIISAFTGDSVESITEVLDPQPETTATTEEEYLTVENCEDLVALLQVNDPGDPIVSTFSSEYYGKIIEFDGCVWAVSPTEYKTRFDILIGAGDFDPNHAYGPNFRFTSVGASNLGFEWSDSIPDKLSVGDNVHIIAEVRTYNDNSQIFELSPISVTVR